MSSVPSVVVLDDGELDRISHLLAEVGAEFVLLRGGEIRTPFQLPRDRLITTATRAVWISELDDVPRWSGAPLWITIHNQDFLPFRERLRELGVHFLVHSAADPEALRLLVLYALYGGAEKRDRPRVPAGYEISYRVGTHSATATLVELRDPHRARGRRDQQIAGEPEAGIDLVPAQQDELGTKLSQQVADAIELAIVEHHDRGT